MPTFLGHICLDSGRWHISPPVKTALVQLKPATPQAPVPPAPAPQLQAPEPSKPQPRPDQAQRAQRKADNKARRDIHRQLTDQGPADKPLTGTPPAKAARRQPRAAAAQDGVSEATTNAHVAAGPPIQGASDGTQAAGEAVHQGWVPSLPSSPTAHGPVKLYTAAVWALENSDTADIAALCLSSLQSVSQQNRTLDFRFIADRSACWIQGQEPAGRNAIQ